MSKNILYLHGQWTVYSIKCTCGHVMERPGLDDKSKLSCSNCDAKATLGDLRIKRLKDKGYMVKR